MDYHKQAFLKKSTRTIFNQPYILPRKKTIFVATCLEIYFIQVGSGKLWNWLCCKGAHR